MSNQSASPGDKAQYQAAYAKIVAKAWADDSFRQSLVANPGQVLSENGFLLANYVDVSILAGQTGALTLQFPLPQKPASVDAQSIQEYLRVTDMGCCCCC
jgi:hypothetical protein